MDYSNLLKSSSFVIAHKPTQPIKLILSDTHLVLVIDKEGSRAATKAIKIKYHDVLGMRVQEVSHGEGDSCQLDIAYMPVVKPVFRSKGTRKSQHISLCLNRNSLNGQSDHKPALEYVKQQIESYISDKEQPEWSRIRKPVLILVNPASGKGHARRILLDKVIPLLDSVGVLYEYRLTEKAGHGKEIAQQLDLSQYYGVIILSGDGLLYEVIQGLMSRADCDQAIQLPIGMLPGGSGNGLCCSLNSYAGESYKSDLLMHSLYVLLKHKVLPMDLLKLDTPTGSIYSFLSVNIGLMADVDIESERFRMLGNARFTVEAVLKILKPKYFTATLYLKLQPGYTRKIRSHTVGCGLHSCDVREQQDVENGDGARMRSTSMPLNMTTADTRHTAVTSSDDVSQQLSTDSLEVADAGGTPNGQEHTKNAVYNESEEGDRCSVGSLPSLDDELPSDWTIIEGSFISILATMQSHIGPELKIAPEATLSDGLIHLLIIRPPLQRRQMIGIMSQLEDGSHITNPLVEVVPVTAFRIVPAQNEGHLVVDGEKIDYGPIQGCVLPKIARVMGM